MSLNEVTGKGSKPAILIDCLSNCIGLNAGNSASADDALTQVYSVVLASGALAIALATVITHCSSMQSEVRRVPKVNGLLKRSLHRFQGRCKKAVFG